VGWRVTDFLGSLSLFSCCIRPYGARTRCRVQARSSTCRHANFNFQVSCMARHDLGTQKRVESSRFGRTQVRGRLTRCGLRRPIQADSGSHLGVQGDDRSDNVVDPVISPVRIELALDLDSKSGSIYLTERKG